MMFNIQELIDDEKCYVEVRKLRWPEGIRCSHCGSGQVTKRGKHNRDKPCQRYHCQGCQRNYPATTNIKGASFAQALVFGWLANPQASLEE